MFHSLNRARATQKQKRMDSPSTSNRFTWRRLPWPVEATSILVGYLLYEVIRGATGGSKHSAYRNADAIIKAERWAHLNIEVWANHLLTAHHLLATLAGYYYGTLHFIITPLVLAWLWRFRPGLYPRLRSSLVLTSLASLTVFVLWPVAPPRFVMTGTTDTLVTGHILGASDASNGVMSLVNNYASMPSLHVAWAVWCAAAIILATRTRWRYLACLYPMATTIVVIGTANHYVLDVLAGAAIALVGLALTRAMPKAMTVPAWMAKQESSADTAAV